MNLLDWANHPALDGLPMSYEARAALLRGLLTLLFACAGLLLARLLSAALRGGARWATVALGTRGVPAAAGGVPLLGHALALAAAPCPWEWMLQQARAKGPLTRFNIAHRTGLIVNDPLGAKRIFQVGAGRSSRRGGGWRARKAGGWVVGRARLHRE